MAVLPRRGPRPRTSQEGPHRQLDQQSPPELWGRLVLACTTLPGVREGHSQVSLASSRALLLDDEDHIRTPGATPSYWRSWRRAWRSPGRDQREDGRRPT